MSVQWDLSNIENAKELCWFENTDPNRTENEKFVLNPVTAGLIHISQFTGVSKITKKNYKELAKRLVELEIIGIAMTPYNKETGVVANYEKDLRNATEAEVEQHIGLSTTVPPKDSRKWKTQISTLLRERAEEYIKMRRESNDPEKQGDADNNKESESQDSNT